MKMTGVIAGAGVHFKAEARNKRLRRSLAL